MLNKLMHKKFIAFIGTLLGLTLSPMPVYAQADDGFGQTIQIYTHFHSVIGNPEWLLIIRDLDHDQVIPYLYEVKQGDNFWLAFTDSRNYRITVSSLRFNPSRRKINNFCSLESGTIKGESLYITINGKLSPNPDTFECHVSRYLDSNFSIAPPAAN
jgi:hypothetical protein